MYVAQPFQAASDMDLRCFFVCFYTFTVFKTSHIIQVSTIKLSSMYMQLYLSLRGLDALLTILSDGLCV